MVTSANDEEVTTENESLLGGSSAISSAIVRLVFMFFITWETLQNVHSWLLHWSLFVSYIVEKDGFDGQYLLALAQDADQLRKYFPIIKECLKFKKLIAMNSEARDNINSVLVR